MKSSVPFCLLLAGMFAAGCAAQKDAFLPVPGASAPSSTIVTPDNSIAGKVVSYNPTARFVVLDFSTGRMPAIEQMLFLYRAGLKVAAVKITGPQSESHIVADMVTGIAQAGDDVRDR
jgi:hypothetical protein